MKKMEESEKINNKDMIRKIYEREEEEIDQIIKKANKEIKDYYIKKMKK